MRSLMRSIAYVALAALLTTADKDPLVIATAANLRPAFQELGERFEAQTGQPVVMSFASSGSLAQQLLEGAPMDLFAPASVVFVERVLAAGVGDAATRLTYAAGRIAIWAPNARWRAWDTLEALVSDGDVTTIAMANPEHAPYGLAAVQALKRSGLWGQAEGRLVYGENAADTLRLAATGNADVAIVALSLALAAASEDTGRYALIDDALHDPLEQTIVITARDPARKALAAQFIALLESDEGREVLAGYGFETPTPRR
jgi:molybdate transport system substrate-binding protein